jgi:hypothetical protein
MAQKVIITKDHDVINGLINNGWIVKSVTAQHVAIATSSSFTEKMEGKFCFVMEKS